MINIKKCIANCMSKYNLSREEATKIATTDNILLSINELRYKYDNMEIGKNYPDWITPEEHLKMCYATVWKKFNKDYFWFNDCNDVAYDLFVYSSIHLHNYTDKYQLNGLLLCRLKNLVRDYSREQDCYSQTYDWEDEVDEENKNTNYSKAYQCNAISTFTSDTFELTSTINSIKNEKIKGILLVSGYFLANIQEFLDPLIDFYNNSSDIIKRKIYEVGRDDIYFCKAINREYNDVNKENITVGRILKIFGQRDKSYLQTDVLPYLKSIGIAV